MPMGRGGGGEEGEEHVPLVEFLYLVCTCMPGGVTVGDSGLVLGPLSVKHY